MSIPRLIIFEGVDAAGKSTVCAKYLSRLRGQGVAAELLSFPGKISRTIGEFVYSAHHNPASVGIDKITSTSLQTLHIAAHLDAIESLIVPQLESGKTIVLDRYWWSTWVYGIIGGVRPEILQALIEVERLAWDKWQPGILFHVTRLTPLREEPADTWPKLVTEYDSLASREAGKYPIQTLSNEGDVEDTVAKAISLSHGL